MQREFFRFASSFSNWRCSNRIQNYYKNRRLYHFSNSHVQPFPLKKRNLIDASLQQQHCTKKEIKSNKDRSSEKQTSMSQETKDYLFNLIDNACQALYPEVASGPNWLGAQRDQLKSKNFEDAKDFEMNHNLAFPVFLLSQRLCKDKKKQQQFTLDLAAQIGKKIMEFIKQDASNTILKEVQVAGPYLNFFLKSSYLAKILPDILSEEHPYLNPRVLPANERETVMIEYSQPNTHKTFHVGHMRNAALGNSLVKLWEFQGHKVYAVNYIGDVGAHIAKCLWYYLYTVKKTTLDEFESKPISREQLEQQLEADRPKDITKVEWLGDMYQNGFNKLDLSQWTIYPHAGIVTAKIISIEDHPNNPKWKVLGIQTDKSKYSVVCGGINYQLNDVVAYAPVGVKKGGRLIQPQDMKGVVSHGLILSEKEFGLRSERNANKDKEEFEKRTDADKEKDREEGKVVKEPSKDDIFVFVPDTPVGVAVTELGRIENSEIPPNVELVSEIKRRNDEVKYVLRAMEEKRPNIDLLWRITRQWSIEDFKSIYEWTDCRFDYYFHESDVGEESKKMTLDAYEKGILVKSNGTIGADLSKWKLGYCMLLTSAGTGLYATKDLALAKRKFEEFKVDRSIYVVDVGQSLHFQQVFKTLELLGFEQAKKCFHLAYGLVVLPEGKMSSRKGTIIYFSKLKNELIRKIDEDFMSKMRGKWPDDEIEDTIRKLAVSTIKYGMLNQDNNKDIVFDMANWTEKTGNTGIYLMYAYARTRSILRTVTISDEEKKQADYSLLVDAGERKLLNMLNMFHQVAAKAAKDYKPQHMCVYLFTLARQLNKLYERVSVMGTEHIPTKAARLDLINATGLILKTGLDLLGISTVERM